MHSYDTKNELWKGVRAAIPIATGYVPVAITYGLVARTAGLSPIDTILSSLLIFAGASQFLAVGMYGSTLRGTLLGASSAAAPIVVWGTSPRAFLVVVQIIVVGWLLNARHLLMSSVIARALDPATPRTVRRVLSFGITDEVFGVASLHAGGGATLHPTFLIAMEAIAYLTWVGGSALGAYTGDVLPQALQTAMGLTLYALFSALLAGQVRAYLAQRNRTIQKTVALWASIIAAAGLNTLLQHVFSWSAGASFPIAMVVGATVGTTVEKYDGTR